MSPPLDPLPDQLRPATRLPGASRPLLVGECNSRGNADPRLALFPYPERCAGGRLVRILGLSRAEYMRLFDRANLCATRWDWVSARARAQGLLCEKRPAYILLGRKVARAFDAEHVGPFNAVQRGGTIQLYVLPHPSGLCREWNDPRAAERARELLSEFLPRSQT